jgi:integrase
MNALVRGNYVARTILGHSSAGITDAAYAHLGHEALRVAAERLAGVVDPNLDSNP